MLVGYWASVDQTSLSLTLKLVLFPDFVRFGSGLGTRLHHGEGDCMADEIAKSFESPDGNVRARLK